MGKITINTFLGISPRVQPRLLKPGRGTISQNTRPTSGGLQAWRTYDVRQGLNSSSPLQTIYRWDNGNYEYWLQWEEDVDIATAPVANDAFDRIYFTGTDRPRVTNADLIDVGGSPEIYPQDSLYLGVPAPTNSLTASRNGTNTTNPIDRVYVYTFVTSMGEEGPPSPVSNTVTVYDGDTVDLTGFESGPTGDYDITKIRIYRTSTGTTSTLFLHVDEQTIPVSEPYNDNTAEDAVGEALPSSTWIAPPDDMVGIINMNTNLVVGISGNQICFCEPGYGHAWPTAYRRTVEDTPIALGHFRNTLVVVTDDYPVLFTGTSPNALQLSVIKTRAPCTSKRSVVTDRDGVMWVTPTGLFRVGVEGARFLTLEQYTREEWQQEWDVANIRAAWYDDKYIGFDDTHGFVYDIRTNEFSTLVGTVDAIYGDPDGDRLYYSKINENINEATAYQTNALREWNAGGGFLTYKWRSALFTVPRQSFSAAIAVGDYTGGGSEDQASKREQEIAEAVSLRASIIASGDVYSEINASRINAYTINGNNLPEIPNVIEVATLQFRLYAARDTVNPIAEGVFKDDRIIRIDNSYRESEFFLEFEGTMPVYEVKIGNSAKDLV